MVMWKIMHAFGSHDIQDIVAKLSMLAQVSLTCRRLSRRRIRTVELNEVGKLSKENEKMTSMGVTDPESSAFSESQMTGWKVCAY